MTWTVGEEFANGGIVILGVDDPPGTVKVGFPQVGPAGSPTPYVVLDSNVTLGVLEGVLAALTSGH
jgi:hypothetical protein